MRTIAFWAVHRHWDPSPQQVSEHDVQTTINVDRAPEGLAVTPDNRRVYVANYTDSTVSVINTRTSRVSTIRLEGGAGPKDVAVSPDGDRVYVTDNNANDVSVIDTATNTLIDTIRVGRDPFGVAASPDGDKVFLSNNIQFMSAIRATSNCSSATSWPTATPSTSPTRSRTMSP